MVRLQEIEGEQLARTHARLEALRAELYSGSSSDEDAKGTQEEAAEPQEQQQLWVDTHAPRSYLQLLSAETANAHVLSWLKSWDPVVFGQAKKAEPAPGLLAGKRTPATLFSRCCCCCCCCGKCLLDCAGTSATVRRC